MSEDLLKGLLSGGAIMGTVALIQTLLKPFTEGAANRQALEKMALERDQALRVEADKMRAGWRETAEAATKVIEERNKEITALKKEKEELESKLCRIETKQYYDSFSKLSTNPNISSST